MFKILLFYSSVSNFKFSMIFMNMPISDVWYLSFGFCWASNKSFSIYWLSLGINKILSSIKNKDSLFIKWVYTSLNWTFILLPVWFEIWGTRPALIKSKIFPWPGSFSKKKKEFDNKLVFVKF